MLFVLLSCCLVLSSCLEIRQSSIWYAGSLGRSSHWPIVWWSKYYFGRLKIKQWVCWLGLRALKTLYFYFCKVIKKFEKNKLKRFLQRILQEIMKEIILGTSDAWSINPATQRIILKNVRFPNWIVARSTARNYTVT